MLARTWHDGAGSSECPIVMKYVIDLPEGVDRSLLNEYLARRHDDVRALRTALDDNALKDARIIGHRLYGSGSAYGVSRISMLGREIELAAEDSDTVRLTDAVEQLAALLDDIAIGSAD